MKNTKVVMNKLTVKYYIKKLKHGSYLSENKEWRNFSTYEKKILDVTQIVNVVVCPTSYAKSYSLFQRINKKPSNFFPRIVSLVLYFSNQVPQTTILWAYFAMGKSWLGYICKCTWRLAAYQVAMKETLLFLLPRPKVRRYGKKLKWKNFLWILNATKVEDIR